MVQRGDSAEIGFQQGSEPEGRRVPGRDDGVCLTTLRARDGSVKEEFAVKRLSDRA